MRGIRKGAALAASGLVLMSSGVAAAQDVDLEAILREQERLRRLVETQAQRIDELESRVGPAAGADSSQIAEAVERYLATRESGGKVPWSGVTKAASLFTVYGFLRLDAYYNDSAFNNAQTPGFVLSEDGTAPVGVGHPRNAENFTLYPRLTRLGIDFDGGTIEGLNHAEVAGKLEIDFHGGGSESRANPRMRHAYLTLTWCEDLEFLAGQTSDLIAPLWPAVNTDNLNWGAGNLGDRRPQARLTWAPEVGPGRLFLQGMAGLAGAVDAQNTDAPGSSGFQFRDGETSGRPLVQGRVAYQFPLFGKQKAEIGVWGHHAWEDPDTPVFNESHFESDAVGFDAQVPLWEDRLWIKGEAFQGRNLDDVRGGIFQGVNTATGEEISAHGGWVELGAKVADWCTLHGGWSVDDVDSSDLGSGGRKKNEVKYAAARFYFSPVEIGVEYLHWRTEYVDFQDGTANRFGAYVAYKF